MTSRSEMNLLSLVLIVALVTYVNSYPASYGTTRTEVDNHELKDSTNKPIVFITVSSRASQAQKEMDRMLELNWDNIPPQTPEKDAWVRLYSDDPVRNCCQTLVSVKPSRENYHKTSIRFPEISFEKNDLSDACLGFWIAYVEDNKILSSNCIRARPRWMEESRSLIGNFSLMDLMIPGTHNSGSYAPFDPSDDNIFNRYLLTQEENVWNQLVYGIRHLDLRVAYQISSTSSEKFWITHSTFVSDISVRDIIRQVKTFLNATNEIVVLDFHRFVNGFKGRRAARRHRELVALLEQELGEYMIPVRYTSWAPLNNLWTSNRRLYVGYADESSRRQSLYLFPAIKHLWGDVDKVDDLKDYLNETVCDRTRPRRLTSAMAQLTPTTAGAIFNLYGGLRNMADAVNRQVTKWFRDEWSQCTNIVATDFFMGNNIIEVTIEANKKKSSIMNFSAT